MGGTLFIRIFGIQNGLNPNAEKFGRGIKFISVMDILSNNVITYDCIRASVEITAEELKSFIVKNGDILFQRSSETLEDVGRANVYMDDKPAVFGGFVIRGKKKSEYNPLFFKYLLATPYARRKIIPMGAGAQHFNIGQEGLSKVKLYFPILQEQHKIASLLQLIDERISTQNKIIEKLQSLIKGIIVTHYSTTAHTIKVKIRELGEAYSTMVMSKEQLTNDGNLCVFYGELFTLYGCVIDKVKSRTSLEKVSSTLSHGRDLLFPASTTVDAVSLIAPSALMQRV